MTKCLACVQGSRGAGEGKSVNAGTARRVRILRCEYDVIDVADWRQSAASLPAEFASEDANSAGGRKVQAGGRAIAPSVFVAAGMSAG